MKKLGLLLIACMIVIGLSGCAKIVSETYEIIPAVVTGAEYTPPGIVMFVCNGRTEAISGVRYYEQFYDKIGCDVWAISRVRVYDNDKVKELIIDVVETKEQAENILKVWTEAE